MEFEGRARVETRLSIAPLIDVVFLLLVFFLLTSTFAVPEALELKLPESDTASRAVPAEIVVAVDSQSGLWLNGEALSARLLGERLEALLAALGETRVKLETDESLSVQDLITVMDLIRGAGGHDLALATRRRD